MTGIIQGKNAVLSFWNGAFVPFVCATDASLSMSATAIPIRTPGDGHWKKVTYQDATYSISLSGTLMYDLSNWTGFDFADNWLNFTPVKFRLVLTDDQGDIKSFQGEVIVTGQNISYSATTVTKTSITLPGNGALMMFDGLIPCPALITSIGITGQTGASGTVTITYAYTGSPYQVRWRINGTGAYLYALIGQPIIVENLVNGTYSVELLPVCQNGYNADNSTSQTFVVTHAQTCSATTPSIATGSNAITPTFTGTPATWKYSFDGGPYTTVPISTLAVSTSGLSVGIHNVSVIPTCSNGVDGSGNTTSFTISVSPTASMINFSLFSLTAPDNVLNVFVNGILNGSLSGSGSSSNSITAPIGATVLGRLNVNNNSGQNGTLTTTDNTTSTTINTQSGGVPTVLAFSFTANGDTFTIGGSIL